MTMSLAIRLSLLLVCAAMFADAAMPINVYHEDLSTSPPRGQMLRSPSRGDSEVPDRYPSPLPPLSRRFDLAGSIVEAGAAAPEPASAASALGGEVRTQATLRNRSSSSARLARDPAEQLDDSSDFSSIDV
jgi:hypothetical protein